MKKLYLLLILGSLITCTKEPTANQIIDNTIEASGTSKVFNSIIEFDFRDKHYVAKYHNYRYELKRIFSDSTGQVMDVLNNDGFTRFINNASIPLDEEWTGKYMRSVNSVIYFFRIPFILKDDAVRPELLEPVVIGTKEYYKIKVTFAEEGGGDDFDDSFIYWINKKTYWVDYLAYSYSTDGGGKRFREALNPRDVNGLHVVDYINYEPKDLSVKIEDYDTYFAEGGLKELSRIENRNVSITYLP